MPLDGPETRQVDTEVLTGVMVEGMLEVIGKERVEGRQRHECVCVCVYMYQMWAAGNCNKREYKY